LQRVACRGLLAVLNENIRYAILLALLMVISLLVAGLLYVTIPMGNNIVAGYGVATSSAALISTAYGLPFAVGFLVWGAVSNRWGRDRVVILGLGLTAVASIGVALAGSFQMLLVARSAQGFVASAVPPGVLAIVTSRLPPRLRPIGVSLISLCFLLAAPSAQQLGAAFDGGLRPIMLLVAAVLLLSAGLVWLQSDRQQPLAASGEVRRSISLHREHVVLAALAGATTIIFGYLMFNAGLQILPATSPVNPATVRMVLLPTMLMALVAGVLIRRYGPLRIAQLGMACIVAGLTVAVVGTALAVIAGAFVMTAGVAMSAPSLIATIATYVHPSERGLALAIYSFVLYVGASAAPVVSNAFADGGFTALCLIPAALSLLALVGLLSVSPPAAAH
jgi:MFS family permease